VVGAIGSLPGDSVEGSCEGAGGAGAGQGALAQTPATGAVWAWASGALIRLIAAAAAAREVTCIMV